MMLCSTRCTTHAARARDGCAARHNNHRQRGSHPPTDIAEAFTFGRLLPVDRRPQSGQAPALHPHGSTYPALDRVVLARVAVAGQLLHVQGHQLARRHAPVRPYVRRRGRRREVQDGRQPPINVGDARAIGDAIAGPGDGNGHLPRAVAAAASPVRLGPTLLPR